MNHQWPLIQKPMLGISDTHKLAHLGNYQWTWRMDDLPTWIGDFKNTFRYYKLNYVKLEFIKKVDSNVLPFAAENNENNAWIPYMRYLRIPEYDLFQSKAGHRINTTFEIGKMMEYQNVKIVQLGKNFSIGIRPYTQAPIYERSALGWAYKPVRGQWLQTTDDEVPYFGLMYNINGVDRQQQSDMWKWFVYDVYVTYYFSVKGLR